MYNIDICITKGKWFLSTFQVSNKLSECINYCYGRGLMRGWLLKGVA